MLNVGTTITNNDPKMGVGKLNVFGEVIDSLQNVGYKSLHLFEDDEHFGFFETRSTFLVAFKAHASRADWFCNEAEVGIRLHQRISRSEYMDFFDAPSMIKYQVPSKATETAYCRGVGDHDDVWENDCNNLRVGFYPDHHLNNVRVSELSVGKSSMGESSGRGLFTTRDIEKGRTIAMEKRHLTYFFSPSTQLIIYKLYDWASENNGKRKCADEVLNSISAVVTFSEGKLLV